MTDPATFAAVFAALYTAHTVADHWIQTEHQAVTKGRPGWVGRLACVRHVGTYTATAAVLVALVVCATGVPVDPARLTAGLLISAVTHYWADRRSTLARFAEVIGKGGMYRLGSPRPGHDDNPSMGTGAYALDQAWHVLWLFVAALVC